MMGEHSSSETAIMGACHLLHIPRRVEVTYGVSTMAYLLRIQLGKPGSSGSGCFGGICAIFLQEIVANESRNTNTERQRTEVAASKIILPPERSRSGRTLCGSSINNYE